MKINQIQDLSEIKSNNSKGPRNKSPNYHQFMGLSPVNKDNNLFCDPNFMQLSGEHHANGVGQVTDVYNFVNISKDDAESLMGLFGDFG